MSKISFSNSQALSGGGTTENPWKVLQQFTQARIGLGRAGVSIPTKELLEFQLSHAQAKDAVHQPLDIDKLQQDLEQLESTLLPKTVEVVQSRASDRFIYLQRPDLGRRLSKDSKTYIEEHYSGNQDMVCDLAIAVVDGLSSKAIETNTLPFLQALLDLMANETQQDWTLAPITIVKQGRVAIGDEIGELFNAKTVLVLVGERPGLSSPDSLGLYLTWNPHIGLTDAFRNCISNIRPEGLNYKEAAKRALFLLQESRRLKLSGVNLKDRSDEKVIEHSSDTGNFLVNTLDK
ncbi:ethanolamine ammonia-lyase subunit EutC [Hydrogenovibrio marinus]|uniref:Ethanolamine ammonia-lyase small subunit n=1 Tax=Hydrogenovibrio marinus TaxID=28885 RepID=A0A066ZNJ5_HYDMR|nr:ethanolamine ammonia-lyase subunit EutC [Hydrogenovibrio marinus]KDN95388.1 ethanolamine ammonia-lyase [Hydrogenovibrio marinus]BBN59877.1 ethanolamine ammonia-lyase light chain [Hydrogenovibrio marinus]